MEVFEGRMCVTLRIGFYFVCVCLACAVCTFAVAHFRKIYDRTLSLSEAIAPIALFACGDWCCIRADGNVSGNLVVRGAILRALEAEEAKW